jgi:hypothetical protein
MIYRLKWADAAKTDYKRGMKTIRHVTRGGEMRNIYCYELVNANNITLETCGWIKG